MDVEAVDLGDVEDTEDTQVEHEVHATAAQPHHVADVRHEFVVARLRHADLLPAVEQPAHQAAERVVKLPYVLRVDALVAATVHRVAVGLEHSAVGTQSRYVCRRHLT